MSRLEYEQKVVLDDRFWSICLIRRTNFPFWDTWENQKSFAATILSKHYICIQSVTDHAYLRLLYLKPVVITSKKMKKEKLFNSSSYIHIYTVTELRKCIMKTSFYKELCNVERQFFSYEYEPENDRRI